MESFEDSNCHSLTDSLSLYERYLRSFNVVDNFAEENCDQGMQNSGYEVSCDGNSNVELPTKPYGIVQSGANVLNLCIENADKPISNGLGSDLCMKTDDSNLCASLCASTENSSATADHSLLTEKSDHTDVPVTSEDSKPERFKQPVFITSTMENSNNAVDSVPLFSNVSRPSDNVFKLPISELSFNGTIKHVQKLKPMVDPITALTSNAGLLDDKSGLENVEYNTDLRSSSNHISSDFEQRQSGSEKELSNGSSDTNRIEKNSESTGDSQYEEYNNKNQDGSCKWNEQSYSSLEASFDSGVRSPDMFSDEDEAVQAAEPEPFWGFLKDYEKYDKRRVRKLEGTLSGVLPPPSVTMLKTDVTDMLKKYYCYLPLFNEEKIIPEADASTPTKRVSFVQITTDSSGSIKEPLDVSLKGKLIETTKEAKSELETSLDKTIELKMGTEIDAREEIWPDLVKCRYYDVYYNTSYYMEQCEQLGLKLAERFVGAETETSVNIYSAGMRSPSSASKRKALRLKMAQAKSPGRRLSHLARRRQAFCSAATISEKAHSSNAKMVLIDKNFFPHRKLINTNERKSPRFRRTPINKTPTHKTPGKITPRKTPRSSSTKKKAMRRLAMESDVTQSQPRNMFKRALFISPENRKVPPQPSSSVPNTMKSRRALFGSPVADTKSSDGTASDQFLKRKRDLNDDGDNRRAKIAKSLSFGGDRYSIGASTSVAISRRASEMFADKNPFDLNETHKKKLLWAVSEALRPHGYRMSNAGFREKASLLARLTRRLLTLPTHAKRFTTSTATTSEIMLRLARQYSFAIIQGRSVNECFLEEQAKIANEANSRISGYISATAYQQLKSRPSTSIGSITSRIKENCNEGEVKQEQPRSTSKNILQDKPQNIDSNSNSSSGMSMLEKPMFVKSNSMPSFEEAAKMRARRQISFDNIDFPKR